jgi:S-adenosylmethionine hydrolase
MLPLPQPHQRPDGSLVGHVLHIDNFGNLITNIKHSDLPPAKELIDIEVGNHLIPGLSRTFAEGQGLLALIGGSDYLEIALRGGSASTFLDAEIGCEVRLRQQPRGNQGKEISR